MKGRGLPTATLRVISFAYIRTYSEIVMYLLVKGDNDINFFRQGGRTRCLACGQLTAKRTEDLSTTEIKRAPRLDITTSVDGVCVVRQNAKVELERLFERQIEFQPLHGGLYAAMPKLIVPFDAAARKTRFIKPCSECSEYESVVGATPVFLVGGSSVPNGRIARTDLEFGSNDEKSPLFLLGDDAASDMLALGLSGCDLVPQ